MARKKGIPYLAMRVPLLSPLHFFHQCFLNLVPRTKWKRFCNSRQQHHFRIKHVG